MSNIATPLSKRTIYLHWLIALVMIGMFAAGQYMSHNEAYWLYPTHKSIGILALLLILPRVINRLREGWPTPAAEAPRWQERMAKIVHWALILATLAMPLSGMMMSGAGGHGLYIFGFELLAANPDPADPNKSIALNETAANIGALGHEIWGKVLAISLILHIVGALKHHFQDRDATLKRMLGR